MARGVCRLGSSIGTGRFALEPENESRLMKVGCQESCAGEKIEKYRFFWLNLIHIKSISHLCGVTSLISVFDF